ncbi:MAG: hypothetical protein ACUVQV_02515 [Dissulfurimicrobium sp.]|uniref:hypothetical protein n=1 Tax=Dissulfurimicrobium sp. TaxID=2022436 RepID=UPI00404A5254
MFYCPVGKDDCLILNEFAALKNECLRLQNLSETDELTGLYNYKYLIKTLDIEMERTLRTGLSTALIYNDRPRPF